jgi:2-keto-3-deoxy-L-rhamnonate aldolase RhmA
LFGAFGPGRPWPVVRAAKNDYHLINWLFDQGAAGVLVPMTNSVEEARRAVQASKFPPLGQRSFGPFRAARYGSRLDTYMPTADKAATLIVQLENLWAAEHIRDILAVQGIDAVFMGPNDLAYSMLQPGETLKADTGQWSAFARTPAVMEICANVMEECRAAGMPFGMTAGSMDEARDWIDRGASFATFGSDFSFMRAGAQHLCGADMERK